MRTCRACGCTEQLACIRPLGVSSDELLDSIDLPATNVVALEDGEVVEVCSWAGLDLCSACAPDAGDGWISPALAELEADVDVLVQAGLIEIAGERHGLLTYQPTPADDLDAQAPAGGADGGSPVGRAPVPGALA